MTSIVSVILPCYNGARWIREAIESVLAQTYKDFELIIVDDGSTDSSGKIVSLYSNDARVCYIYQKNRGFSAAINKGIRESKGDFVGFIGQDDMWMPKKLGLQLRHFREHRDVDLVHSSYCFIDSAGRILQVIEAKTPDFSSKTKLIEQLFLGNFIGFETVLVKRKCFDRVGLFDERMMGFSDHDMWLRIAGSFNIEGYLDLILIKKRQHAAQLSKILLESLLRDEFLLCKKAIKKYPFLRKVERKRLAALYYTWGMALLQKGSSTKAKEKIIKALRCRPLNLKFTVAYLIPLLYKRMWYHYINAAPEFRAGLRWLES